MPTCYRQLRGKPLEYQTYFRAIVGPGTAFEGTQGLPTSAITDGPAQTIAVIKTARAVDWTKPEEVLYSAQKPVPVLGSLAVFADGMVRQLDPKLDERTRRALLTRQGGEKVDASQLHILRNTIVATKLNDEAWALVSKPGLKLPQYREGLRLATASCRLDPKNGLLLNTLGAAQYRVNEFTKALATLTESDKLNSAQFHGSLVADLAFLAMCHHRLGHTTQAAEALGRLREKMKDASEVKIPENQALLGEAEALIAGPRPASGNGHLH
jgi:hypothetical protein